MKILVLATALIAAVAVAAPAEAASKKHKRLLPCSSLRRCPGPYMVRAATAKSWAAIRIRSSV